MKYDIPIPKRIKVGGLDYRIVMGRAVTIDLRDRKLWGEHSGNMREIRLSMDAPSTQQLSDTFFHEILHAVDAVYNSDGLEERENVVLAHGLQQVFDQLGIRFVVKK